MPPSLASRDQRHLAIRSLLRRSSVRSQDELVGALRQRGFEATQSSVSRDLAELGVVKAGGRYRLVEAAGSPEGSAILADAAHFLRRVQPAGPHLAVLLTVTGAAQTVGIAIDRAEWPEVVGTIAGDDTVFVATAGPAEQKRLLARINSLLQREAS